MLLPPSSCLGASKTVDSWVLFCATLGLASSLEAALSAASAGVGQMSSSSLLRVVSTAASASLGALSWEALGLARGVGSGLGVSWMEEDSSV